jgi:Zn-dependent protease
VSWVAVVFVSVLVHELGHAVAGLAFGRKVDIELHGMGGTTRLAGEPTGPVGQFVVALAGPAAGFLLGGMALLAQPFAGAGMPGTVVADLVWANLGWGVLNLLPIRPLDGSHALEAALNRIPASSRSRLVGGVSISTAVVLGVVAVYFEVFTLLFLLGWLVLSQLKSERDTRAWEADQIFVQQATTALDAEEPAAALQPLETLASDARTPSVARWAREALTSVYVGLDRHEDALRVLDESPDDDPVRRGHLLLHLDRPADALGPLLQAMPDDPRAADMLLLAFATLDRDEELFLLLTDPACTPTADGYSRASTVAFYAARFATSQRLSGLAFEASSEGAHAFNAACAAARRGRVDEGLAWMEQVAESDFTDPSAWDEDEDIAALRLDPRWTPLRRSVG